MSRKWVLVFLFVALPSFAQLERNVHFTGDFESGRFLPNGGDTDSFFIKTLPDPQIGREVIRTGSGGGSPSSSWDSKVLQSQTVGGQLVTPRRGKYFARHVLHYDKDYRDLNDGILEKARTEFHITHDSNLIDFDREVYAGVSIFVPLNYEHETGTRMRDTLIVLNASASATLFVLRTNVPKDDDEAHWIFEYPINPNTVREGGGTSHEIDLGRVNADKGKWTDFVLRFRSNPFSVATNPAEEGIANAHDQLYQGNKGILQLWKAEGPEDEHGNRRMVRKINRENKPVGNVPGTTNGKSKLQFSLRIYKSYWQTRTTHVKGPIYYGFDEFRFGEAMRDGTTYMDVHPTQMYCTDGCPAGSEAPEIPAIANPKPPTQLIVM